ncbi:WhiB family transcriptional regulator [Actinoallomurus rhizosphaericola]|uniref:WhiB family transcriptional regulator n=1 Tax=Actinoallomurus rhizosphaericola TaxID=2952536 RepID=UPI002090CCB0|nr:WhiB family transcriptional regulator [Actinoallomurus rhizosphaericola]MCO5994181.1 WhiB family transcriptional regulator [Actinoallomurus rhizosphaericola]
MLFDVSWMNRAECQKVDPELFFPIGSGRLTPVQVSEARAVCGRCPVRQDCLRYALETGQGHGVWGGIDEDERRVMRSGARRSFEAARQGHGRPAR